MSELLTIAEVLALLKCERDHLRKLRRQEVDPLPTVNLGGAIRFDAAEVEAWIRRQALNSTPAKAQPAKRRVPAAVAAKADRFLKGAR